VRVIRTATQSAFAGQAADLVVEQLRRKPASVVALPTGATPLPLYEELVRRARAGAASLAAAQLLNLDEYAGLARSAPRSFAAFLDRHLFEPLALERSRLHLIDGAAANWSAECGRYERSIAACGGIDLCILGLGENGHIAFNEPGTPWDARTHVAELSPSTRARIEAQGWDAGELPSHALTLGIANVLEARRALLLIAGRGKQAASAALHRGKEDLAWPVTALTRHADLTVIEWCAPAASP
jgi:glucosamine-6-phosphate deaminase